MKQTITVFISCPFDMGDSRQVAEQAVKNFSKNYCPDEYSFDTVHFKDVATEFGGTPQDIINKTLPDYDVYLGIMGGRFGTPTTSYQSGTQEEFYIALERFQNEKNLLVSFLFQDVDTPVATMSESDIEQFLKVKKFKTEISNQGVYKTYKTPEELMEEVNTLLRRVLSKISEQDSEQTHQMEMIASVPSKEIFKIDKSFYSDFLNYVGADLTNNRKEKILLDDIYVPLDLSILNYKDEKDNLIIEDERVCSKDLDSYENQSETHLIISGEEHSGKTTFCKNIFVNFHTSGIIPVYIKGEQIRNSSGKELKKLIEKEFVKQYSSRALPAYKSLEKNQKLLIIDDIEKAKLNDKFKFKVLEKIQTDFSHIYITSDDLFLFNAKLSSSESMACLTKYRSYKIRDLGHSLRDKIIRKWLVAGREEKVNEEFIYSEAEKYRKILDSVIGYNFVPKKPLMILVLLQAVQGGSSNELAHSSYVRYYKYLIDSTLLANIQRTKQEVYYGFLPELAFAIYSNSGEPLSVYQMKKLIEDFCDNRGLHTELLDDVKSTLLTLEFLVLEDENFDFKHSYSYYYFLGQYFSDHLSEEKIREEVTSICKKIHIKQNADIIIFLSHHSNDSIIVESIFSVTEQLFTELDVYDFDSSGSTAINNLVHDSPKVVVKHQKEKSKRAEILKANDDIEDKRSRQDDEEISEAIDLGKQLNIAFRSIEIIGQLLKNHFVSFDGNTKKDLYIKATKLGMKCLNLFIEHLSNDSDLLLEHILKNDKKIETEKDAQKAIFSLASLITFSFIKAMSQYTGSEDLSKTYEDVAKENDQLALKIIILSTKLDFFDAFPINDLKNIALSSKHNHLAMMTLKSLVKYRLYMRPIDDYKKKQQICSSVGIDLDRQLVIQNKGKSAA